MPHAAESKAQVSGVLSIAALALSVVAVAHALSALMFPPFTDQQLRDNVVDTWEAHTFGESIVVVLFLACCVASCIAAWFVGGSYRSRLVAASIAFLMAIALQLFAVNSLTERAERVTGASLSWF
jgi:hypothetical protein